MVPAGNKAKSLSSVSHTTKTIHHHHHHHRHHRHIFEQEIIFILSRAENVQNRKY